MLISCSRCGHVHQRGKCPIKRKTKTKRSDIRRFRSSSRWKRLAAIIRDRDDNLCQACLHDDPPTYTGDELEVHHIIPIAESWEDRLSEDNGITLCRNHHELAECGLITCETLRAWVEESKARSENI